LLYAIWEIQSEFGNYGKGVTRKEMAARLGKTENRVSGIIHSIQSASASYLRAVPHPPPGKEGERGHPLNHYHLNHEEIVTIPETARILLELTEFPSEMKLRINRNEFVKYLMQSGKVKEPEHRIQRRISWAIEKSYLYGSEDGDYIWPHGRIDCEREYLLMVARHAM
jgi:hypothetical protein